MPMQTSRDSVESVEQHKPIHYYVNSSAYLLFPHVALQAFYLCLYVPSQAKKFMSASRKQCLHAQEISMSKQNLDLA